MNHYRFRAFQHHSFYPRWPSRYWSDIDTCHVSATMFLLIYLPHCDSYGMFCPITWRKSQYLWGVRKTSARICKRSPINYKGCESLIMCRCRGAVVGYFLAYTKDLLSRSRTNIAKYQTQILCSILANANHLIF